MEFFEAIDKRASVREFSNKPILHQDIEQILNAGRLAATARNEQPWRFVAVTSKALIEKLGEMVSPNGSATYGQLVTLGIMQGADPEAQKVVEFFLTDQNYQDVLALAPFGKVPVLKSAVDGWMGLSPFFENYSDETLGQIANGFDTMQRWLFRPDYDATQRAVIGDIEGRLLIPQVISNIALEGIMTPETGAQWLQEQVEALVAERQQ